MTIKHFAGLNTAAFAQALEGHPVLISYADIMRRPGVWEREILPRLLTNKYSSVILDSGAFTELTTPGFHVDIHEYAAFIREHSELFDYIVNLDDIGGDVERSKQNQETLERTGADIMPVFHGREAWAQLEEYLADGHDHIGVGFFRDPNGRVSSDQGEGLHPDEWLDEVFHRCEGRATIHGFGMTRHARVYPFKTTDSTTWIAEYCAMKRELPGQHGTTGGLRTKVLGLTQQQLIALVLNSYTTAGGTPDPVALMMSKGQARTVVARYSQRALRAALSTHPHTARGLAVLGPDGHVVVTMMTEAGAERLAEDLSTGPHGCPHN